MALMNEAMVSICDLQPQYSYKNTPAMAERWRLLKQVFQPEVEGLHSQISAAMGKFGDDLFTEARDGTGNKIELPWLRFGSKSRTPSATKGYYVVVHFNTDGTAANVGLGCGASHFTKGSFKTLPDSELQEQTS